MGTNVHLVKFDTQDFKAKNVKTLLRPAIWKQLMINYKNTKKDFKNFSMGSQKKKKASEEATNNIRILISMVPQEW